MVGREDRTTYVGKASSCESLLFGRPNDMSISTCESSSVVNSSDMSNNYLSNRIVVGLNDNYSSNKMVVGSNDVPVSTRDQT